MTKPMESIDFPSIALTAVFIIRHYSLTDVKNLVVGQSIFQGLIVSVM
jgi:hypothetical protein